MLVCSNSRLKVALAALCCAALLALATSCGGDGGRGRTSGAGSVAVTAERRAPTATPTQEVGQVRGPVLEVANDGSWLVEERAGSAAVVPTGRTVRVVFDPAAPPVDGNRNPVAIDGLAPRTDSKSVIVIGIRQPDGSLRATILMYW